MQQKKPFQKKKEEKSGNIRIYMIMFLIFIPFIYLMYRNYAIPNKSSKVELLPGLDTTTTSDATQAAKLKTAIDMATSQPNETNYINLGLLYFNQAKYKECIDATKKALDYNPQSYLAYNNLCSAYYNLGMWDEAIAAGEKALEIKPGDQLATNNLKISRDGKQKEGK